MDRRTILILYYTRWVYPLRDTIKTHLYAWKNYSRHRAVYVNVAIGFPARLIKELAPDIVLFHTLFLGMRWTPSIFRKYTERCAILKEMKCLKIAMPQDEFLNTALLNDFIRDFGITHILTCASQSDWPIIYHGIDPEKIVLKRVLTGYIDHNTLRRIERKKKKERAIDIGYRAWKAEFWLGEQGIHKARIADLFKKAADERGLKADISLEEKEVLNGDEWFDFLLSCRATIGVEGGSSVLDREGAIKKRVDEYLAGHPFATFEETRTQCFPKEDGRLKLACISPRHLEACITRTCQILVEGDYNGILKAGEHYVLLKRDYSNLEETLGILRDEERLETMTARAYSDVVASGRWSYEAMVREIEELFFESLDTPLSTRKNLVHAILCTLIIIKDSLDWLFILLEKLLKDSIKKFLSLMGFSIGSRSDGTGDR
jgi:hypothetical protein